MSKTHIYNLTTETLSETLDNMGQPGFRTKQLIQGLYNKLYTDFDQFDAIPKSLRETLDQQFTITPLKLHSSILSKNEDTEKVLFETDDGHLIESVLMRFERRNTLCLSTQVGCPMACAFCATGQQGFARNLSMAEILGQFIHFQRELRQNNEALRNVVFMGMGEPFLNYENVSNALYALSDPERLGIGARHITVSTVGIIPRIAQFAKDHPQVSLAISLHAPDDALRTKLLPANKQYPLDELIKSCKAYIKQTNRKITFEYALIDQVNDTIEHAHAFAKLIKGMLSIVNLITLNPSKAYPYPGSSNLRVQTFRNILVDHGIRVTVRLRRGIEINAGCGHLAGSITSNDII